LPSLPITEKIETLIVYSWQVLGHESQYNYQTVVVDRYTSYYTSLIKTFSLP
jgi:hypothetical protein